MAEQENVLILGASRNPERYSYKAMISLNKHGHKTFLIGKGPGPNLLGNVFYSSIESLPKDVSIDTITVYLSIKNQQQYEEAIIKLKPKRVIFNPGAENMMLFVKLNQSGIQAVNACTLVLLSIGNY
jgi:predicted CoA-binding protein